MEPLVYFRWIFKLQDLSSPYRPLAFDSHSPKLITSGKLRTFWFGYMESGKKLNMDFKGTGGKFFKKKNLPLFKTWKIRRFEVKRKVSPKSPYHHHFFVFFSGFWVQIKIPIFCGRGTSSDAGFPRKLQANSIPFMIGGPTTLPSSIKRSG